MRRIAASFFAIAFTFTAAAPAMADGWRHRGNGWGGYHRGYSGGWEGGYRHHRRGGDWVGPAVALGILGLALGAAASQPYPSYGYGPATGYGPPTACYPQGCWALVHGQWVWLPRY